MAEETQAEQQQEASHGAEGEQAGEQPQAKDWRAEYERVLAESRKWEERAKRNAGAAKELDGARAQSETDAERAAEATRRAEEAEARLAEYARREERAGVVAEVARTAGVDAGLLGRMAGATREEVEANAECLKAAFAERRSYPSVDDGGARPGAAVTKEDISRIKDPRERVRVRAQHLDLYQ